MTEQGFARNEAPSRTVEEQITGLDGLNVAADVSLRIQNVSGLVHLVQDGLVLVRKDDVGLEGFDAQQGLAQRA